MIKKNNIKFKITCTDCKAISYLYTTKNNEYDIQNSIECTNCKNKKEIYGCDG